MDLLNDDPGAITADEYSSLTVQTDNQFTIYIARLADLCTGPLCPVRVRTHVSFRWLELWAKLLQILSK